MVRRAEAPGATRSPARALVLAILCAGCVGEQAGLPAGDAGPSARRWPRPTGGPVRAYPPHAIRADGVGPYLLDAPLADVLHLLPEGPRIELLQVGRLVNWRVVRAEEGRLLIGADDKNRVAFIAVLSKEVARTEEGLAVGSSGKELLAALGAERTPGDRVLDRRVFELQRLPGVRWVTDAPVDAAPERARVVAIVVERAPEAPDGGLTRLDAGVAASPDARARCRDGGPLAAASSEIAVAARGRTPPRFPAGDGPLIRFGCFTGASPEAVAVGPGQLTVVGGEPGKVKRVAGVPLAEATFVSPLDADGDGRDEIVVGVHVKERDERAVELRLFRFAAGRLAEVASARPFAIDLAQAAGAGATPAGIDLAVEVVPARGALKVGGLYLTREGDAVREVAPITPVTVRWSPSP